MKICLLGTKDREADTDDDLGIKYAFLGYHQEAIELFQKAASLASETSDKDLQHDMKKHLEPARNQLHGRSQKPANILTLFRLAFFQVKPGIVRISKNAFMENTALNRAVSIYLEWGSPDGAALRRDPHGIAKLYTLADNVQFEWSNEFLVMQTLLELGQLFRKSKQLHTI